VSRAGGMTDEQIGHHEKHGAWSSTLAADRLHPLRREGGWRGCNDTPVLGFAP